MRKSTLSGVSFLLAMAIMYGLSIVGVRFPFGLSPLFAGVVLAPVLLVLLTIMNQRLLAWRKARGRDIEEEERYEHDGIISLRPRE